MIGGGGMRHGYAARWGRRAAAVALSAVALVFVAPLVALLPVAFAGGGSAFAAVFELLPWARYSLNSLLITALGTVISLLVAASAGFAVALLGGRAAVLLITVALLLRSVPPQALWLPRLLLYQHLGWLDSLAALLAPALLGTSPLHLVLYAWAFRRVPRDIYDLARLDGLGACAIWWRVAMPLVRPTSGTVALLVAVWYWSDFVHPLLYLRSETFRPVAVGLRTLQQLDPTGWPVLMAGALLMIAPVVMLYLVAQRAVLDTERMSWDD